LKQTLYVDDATYYTDGSELKQTLYVDDATYYTDGSETSLSELSFSIEEFGKISGLRLNSSKTIVMRMGALRTSNTTCPNFKHFKWTSNSAKTLGFQFPNDGNFCHTQNLLPKYDDFKNCLKRWQHRKLTLHGQVTALKTFAIPKLISPLTVLPNPPDHILRDIEHSINTFMWDWKIAKIKHNILIQTIENGGISMSNINNILHITVAIQ